METANDQRHDLEDGRASAAIRTAWRRSQLATPRRSTLPTKHRHACAVAGNRDNQPGKTVARDLPRRSQEGSEQSPTRLASRRFRTGEE